METAQAVLSNNIQSSGGVVKVLIAVPLTREWAIEMQAKQLAALDTSLVQARLLIFVDNKDISKAKVVNMLERYEVPMPYTVHNTGNNAPQELRLFHRRDRIRDMLATMQDVILDDADLFDNELLFMVEDDTKIEPDALTKLVVDYEQLTQNKVQIGFIEGAQVGRHGIRMIGAWKTDDLDEPTVMSTIPYNNTDLFTKIDGGGLYCFLTPLKLFLDHEFYWHDECFSVDVTYGLELRKLGYVNIIDWSVVAGHADRNGNVLVPNENCTVAEYKKQPDGTWKLQSRKGGVS